MRINRKFSEGIKLIFYSCAILFFISFTVTEISKTNIKTEMENDQKKKVTGIGGIFFKSQDPEKIKEWYSKNLGLVTDQYGSMFEFREAGKPDEKAYLQWSPFGEKSTYFEPSKKDFMINYRVEDLVGLVDELKKNGVQVLDSIETYDYGKFVHILDPENNKIELWEPIDKAFTEPTESNESK